MATNLLGWVSVLAQTHTPRLVQTARHEGLAAHDALDAVQEAFVTFLTLPQARSLAVEQSDAEQLMTVIVRNAARNMRRRHHRSRPHDSDEAIEDLRSDEPSIDELIAQAEAHIGLAGCVNRLGEVQRQVVVLRMLEGVAAGPVAAELGLSESNVGVLLHRAKARLRLCLSEAR